MYTLLGEEIVNLPSCQNNAGVLNENQFLSSKDISELLMNYSNVFNAIQESSMVIKNYHFPVCLGFLTSSVNRSK